MEGRGNITIAADYYSQSEVVSADDDSILYGGSGIPNVLEGSVRTRRAFRRRSVPTRLLRASIAGLSAFLPASADFQRVTHFGPFSLQESADLLRRHSAHGPGPSPQGSLHDAARAGCSVAGGLASAAAHPFGFSFFRLRRCRQALILRTCSMHYAPGVSISCMGNDRRRRKSASCRCTVLQRQRPTPYEICGPAKPPESDLFAGTFGTGNPTTAAQTFSPLNGFQR